jgi:hypothetical protein
VIVFPATVTPVAPKSATPIPDRSDGKSSLAGHDFVLWVTRLAVTLKRPAGPGASARTATAAQLSCKEFATTLPCNALRISAPNRLSKLSLPPSFASAFGESPI